MSSSLVSVLGGTELWSSNRLKETPKEFNPILLGNGLIN